MNRIILVPCTLFLTASHTAAQDWVPSTAAGSQQTQSVEGSIIVKDAFSAAIQLIIDVQECLISIAGEVDDPHPLFDIAAGLDELSDKGELVVGPLAPGNDGTMAITYPDEVSTDGKHERWKPGPIEDNPIQFSQGAVNGWFETPGATGGEMQYGSENPLAAAVMLASYLVHEAYHGEHDDHSSTDGKHDTPADKQSADATQKEAYQEQLDFKADFLWMLEGCLEILYAEQLSPEVLQEIANFCADMEKEKGG